MDFLFGFVLGILVFRIYSSIALYFLEKRLEEKIENTLKEFRKNVVNSKIEVVNDMYFMYNRETSEFLGQAKTFEELEKVMKAKYPNKLFNVPHNELMEALKAKNENR